VWIGNRRRILRSDRARSASCAVVCMADAEPLPYLMEARRTGQSANNSRINAENGSAPRHYLHPGAFAAPFPPHTSRFDTNSCGDPGLVRRRDHRRNGNDGSSDERSACSVHEIARGMNVSRPAVSQRLKVLKAAGSSWSARRDPRF
jgi:hypothetical protein